ncbi:molybdopterin molybdotransferase MoeA [Acinetobacter sp. WZC-1]|uniref:molybdopterin molybdotransferase MoeA n=1 Tax=Acinetobacter sp. WZC-1 TaxID=3459034 RepID=UPI00403DBD8B
MSCSGIGLITVDQALAHYRSVKTLSTASLPLIQAHQHVLATDVRSTVSLPLFTQSAVDGYALRSEDLLAGITEFELAGEVRAGIAEHVEIQSGQTVRIFTGGKLPDSADTVARQEIITRTDNHTILNQVLEKGTDIRYQGEELTVGTILAHKGQRLSSGLIAALSMAGVHEVQVYQQPKIAVLITGDEVSTQLDNESKVFDANAPMILTWLKEQGLTDVHLQHVIDDENILSQALSNAMHQYDLVITTGGVSVGDYDLIRPVSMALGAKEIFWQVAQKPGKPLYFAEYQRDNHCAYLLGLPGNPAAVLTCLAIHASTLIAALQGIDSPAPAWKKARFTETVKQDSREQLLRMVVNVDDYGQLTVSKLGKQQSHMLSNLNQANALVRIPARPDVTIAMDYVDFISL